LLCVTECLPMRRRAVRGGTARSGRGGTAWGGSGLRSAGGGGGGGRSGADAAAGGGGGRCGATSDGLAACERVPASPAAARAPLRAKPKVSAADKIKACAPGGRLRLWASTAAAGEAGCSAGARPAIAPAEFMRV